MKGEKNNIRVALLQIVMLMMATYAYAQNEVKSITQVASEQIKTARGLFDLVVEIFVNYGFQVLGGIVVLVVGWLVAGYIEKIVNGLLQKKNIDVTVSKFIVGTVKLLVMAFAVIVALGKFGIEIAPLIAGISVAGFGLSFALQGPLSNYASGATLIFTKPFKVGDIVEVCGVEGQVVDMKLPRTELITLDGELIVIPNKHIIGEIILNCSDSKRIDINVGVSYSSDIDKVIKVVTKIINDEERIVKTKTPKIGISEFADSSINIYARAWCKQEEYLDVKFAINKKIFDEFNKNAIEIPFPQRVVHNVK
ncbi:MAG: mechanosensitive ion channel [Candidatus Omnitrophica bacterium]|nr:mechanosensitive ion channel [Candidatus Omnitrophota bacterium]MBU1997405.1 mechanosensitive ion channel [Candidatus Omnitrophota bacterium]